MSGPAMILTGPQAAAIGVVALAAWVVRAPLCRIAHALYWGPTWGLDDEDDDYVDFVGANPDLYLGPLDGGDL